MSRITKNVVNKALIHQKAPNNKKLKILLLGQNKVFKELLESGDDYYSYEKYDGIFLVKEVDVYNNLSFEFDFVLSLDPYKTLRYMYELHQKVKYPLICIHTELPKSKKELVFQAAFELEKHTNIVFDESFKSQLYLAGAHLTSKDIDWRKYFYELLLKKS